MIKLDKRGYVMLYVVGLMGLVLLLVLTIFIPLNNQTVMIRNNIEDLEDFYKEQAGLERFVSIFARNISYSKDTVFDDLEREYKIVDIDIQQQNVAIRTNISYRYTEVNFYVNNHTTINIHVQCDPITEIREGEIGFCYIAIYAPSGEKIFSTITATDKDFEIPLVYDPITDTWGHGYGNYAVRVIPFLSSVAVSVDYNKIIERTVQIVLSENKKYIFTITNNESKPNFVTRIFPNE